MDSIFKSEIFFFISSISVVLITVVIVIFGFYLIKMMRDFSHISNKLKQTVDGAASSLEEIGENIKDSPVFSFFFGKRKKNKK